MKNSDKKFLFSDFLLWSVLVLSIAHLVFLLLGVFNVLTPKWLTREYFNYILAFVLVALCLCLYICLMLVERTKRLVIPEWFKVVFYVGFYVFTNIYYYFGLYGSVAGLIVFYLFFAFVLNIIALAVFFNTQKSDTNVLKTSTTFTTLTTFTYAVSAGAILEVLVSAVKIIFFSKTIFATLQMMIIEMCIIILVSILMAIAFSLSMIRTKKLINNCLIKFYKEPQKTNK